MNKTSLLEPSASDVTRHTTIEKEKRVQQQQQQQQQSRSLLTADHLKRERFGRRKHVKTCMQWQERMLELILCFNMVLYLNTLYAQRGSNLTYKISGYSSCSSATAAQQKLNPFVNGLELLSQMTIMMMTRLIFLVSSFCSHYSWWWFSSLFHDNNEQVKVDIN